MSIKGILTVAAASAALATAGAAFAGEPTPSDEAPAHALSTPVDQPAVEDSAATPAPANVVTTIQTPTLRVELVASNPVPDTPANRRAYGAPESNAGKRTAPSGN